MFVRYLADKKLDDESKSCVFSRFDLHEAFASISFEQTIRYYISLLGRNRGIFYSL